MINYKAGKLYVNLTKKETDMLNLLVDIIGENRSEMVRRLLIQEAKRAVAYLDDEETPLWISLIKDVEMERDYMSFQKGEAIREGRRKAYKERTGVDMDIYREREMDELKDKQREWQRNHRRKERMKKLEEFKEEYGIETLPGKDC